MIDLYYAPTPNGHKITLFLEEANLPYQLHRVNISKGEQFKPEFLAISPNNKIPAIVDTQPAEGDTPISLFESGAILLYLAEKYGVLLSSSLRERTATLQWLFWQVAGFGPMLGQNHHFNHYAPQPVPYAIERYQQETQRLYRVLDKHLQDSPWLAGEHYSIADIATYPWVVSYTRQRVDLDDYPAVKAWYTRINERPATQRAYQRAEQ
ncbi:GSH-dependent disulfide bond oxidoreductase [Pectobacterium punjabense]|uniref:GSH-dependent disulfide bond oxidoreductase n=1 Tax=Pectobacterium punjabense TaxID=2108399 RepID=A0ABX6L444_9GAMM|nr:GSH-dependent disulfide bond oxidoreductase [Pectobacterium punjabense]MBN3138084.1 GSH-dependent disulfide bond oxidoreductase [Pectobacterium punjabense]MBS4429366.1 GSH-dependent disulfide bond oxidoreductase [Pectobacterium punjabense]MBT9184769.1 GSH-dependent disulfide bond oxidoreductase [Pectobacterium punjabense]MCE5381481.1 GSH-dependent disulfide bond oxidoreductase [Pectobacterium punjabense]MDG0796170.1 GSH-dependent disulfide bond oxidoreductase [Pectobacterium punjabense]